MRVNTPVQYRLNLFYAVGLTLLCALFALALGAVAVEMITEPKASEPSITLYTVLIVLALVIVTQTSKGKLIMLGALTGVFIIVAILQYSFGVAGLVALGALLSGAGAAFLFWKAVVKRQPVMEVRSDHLFINNNVVLGKAIVIPWQEISEILIEPLPSVGFAKQNALVIYLKNAEKVVKLNPKSRLRTLIKMTNKNTDGHITVAISHLDESEESILKTIKSYL